MGGCRGGTGSGGREEVGVASAALAVDSLRPWKATSMRFLAVCQPPACCSSSCPSPHAPAFTLLQKVLINWGAGSPPSSFPPSLRCSAASVNGRDRAECHASERCRRPASSF